jgi:hypothetical protein
LSKVTRLRTLLADNQLLVENSVPKGGTPAANPHPNVRASLVCNPHAGINLAVPSNNSSSASQAKIVDCKSPHFVDFSKFEKSAESFKIEDAPTLKDCKWVDSHHISMLLSFCTAFVFSMYILHFANINAK